MGLHTGENVIDDVPIDVVRKRIRRINVRIGSDGRVHLSVPKYWATLADGEAFLREHWDWVLKTRAKCLSAPAASREPVTDFERRTLMVTLDELNGLWTERLQEAGVRWKTRTMKTLWGSCHWRKRLITYSTELARAPRDLVEYVVVHELTHLQAHDHGPRFYALMDARLPDWKVRRTRLNKRDFITGTKIVQGELW